MVGCELYVQKSVEGEKRDAKKQGKSHLLYGISGVIIQEFRLKIPMITFEGKRERVELDFGYAFGFVIQFLLFRMSLWACRFPNTKP